MIKPSQSENYRKIVLLVGGQGNPLCLFLGLNSNLTVDLKKFKLTYDLLMSAHN